MVASSTGVTGVLGLDFLDIDLDMDRLAATFGISLDSSSASGLSSCGVSIFLEQSIHTFWASLKLYSFNLDDVSVNDFQNNVLIRKVQLFSGFTKKASLI